VTVRTRKSAKGKTVYDVFYRVPGGNRTCRRGLPRDIAYTLDDKMTRLNAAYRAGINLNDMTVEELAADWLEHKEQHVRGSTLADYKSVYEGHLEKHIKDRLIFEVRPLELQRLIDGMAARPRTANKALTILKSMFRQAVIWNYLEASPASELKRIPEKHTERPFLTVEEASKLLSVLKGRDRLLVYTALVTGLRSGELAALTWQDIEGNLIRVRRSYRDGVFSPPKTVYGRRDVIIPKDLAEQLEAVRGRPHYLVFPDEPYGPLPRWKMIKQILRPALKRASIEKEIRFHDLRHTYATWCISQGESVKFVQEQLGHSTPEFTMARYGHLAPDAKEAAMRRFEQRTVAKLHQDQSEPSDNVIQFPQQD
jgi:integrase